MYKSFENFSIISSLNNLSSGIFNFLTLRYSISFSSVDRYEFNNTFDENDCKRLKLSKFIFSFFIVFLKLFSIIVLLGFFSINFLISFSISFILIDANVKFFII